MQNNQKRSNNKNNKNNKKSINMGIIYLFLIFGVLLAFTYAKDSVTNKEIPYNEFMQMLDEGKISKVSITNDNIIIEEKEADSSNNGKTLYTININDKDLIAKLQAAGVEYRGKLPKQTPIMNILITWILPMVAIFFMWKFLFSKMGSGMGGGGVMGIGKNNAKVYVENEIGVTFDDVAGQEEAKESLKEVIDFLNCPSKYTEIGAKLPKGVLLVGPPGTGKTLIAKAVAGEAKVPFFSLSGSSFVEMFVGVGASRVRELFKDAVAKAPCIVFIDEIDAVGRQRGAGLGGGHDEREQTLNQLLVEMDGFGANEGIIMIAATNRPDILDPALLRPGRFDRQIVVGTPDVKGREEILKVHTKKKPLGDDVELKVLAKRTPGFAGADLENLANEAALLAVRRNKKVISMEEMEEAITRVIAGPEKKSRVITEHDKKLTAYHEAGHAVVMRLLPNCDPVHEISIIPRGRAGGYTMHLPEQDTSYTSKSKLKDEMVGLLGGRVAEQLIMGDISTGAKNDIDRASSIAKSMVMEYGMSEEIGTISFNSGHDEVFLGRDFGKGRDFSEELGAKMDKEIKKFIDEAYEKANSLLKDNINKLHAVAAELLDKEKIDGKEFEAIFDAN